VREGLAEQCDGADDARCAGDGCTPACTCPEGLSNFDNPPNCPRPAFAVRVNALRDDVPGNQCRGGLNANAGCVNDSECPGGGSCSAGTPPVNGQIKKGKTFYNEMTLTFDPLSCGYKGGLLCVDTPGAFCPAANPPISPNECVGGANPGARCSSGSECAG